MLRFILICLEVAKCVEPEYNAKGWGNDFSLISIH